MILLPELRELFVTALELPAGERLTLLAGLPEGTRAELSSLLQAHESAGAFLDSSGGSLRPGDRIGPYRIIEEVGHGGMGVVYRAGRDDGEFHREVAVKVVGGRLFAPEAERRFIAERNILAVLDHPNIVRMIDGGVWNRQRFLVMEYVAGQPLTDHCDTRALPLAGRLRLFQTLCTAIQYAHVRLVIHRDLKPQNILVTAEGDLKVLDFGIARLLEHGATNDSNAGEPNTILHPLTLSCASPEQLRGETLTLASDIYALGLLLYELLTGTNPQARAAQPDILRMADSGGPPAPGRLAPGISPDLDAIVLKALANEPARRYGSAAEMSSDVARFLENRPVLARPPSRLSVFARMCARNRAMTAVVVALVIAVLAGLAATSWQARRAEQQRQIAERRFDDARRLIYTLIHEIEPQMAAVDGTVTIRRSLVEKTLGYLEALWKDSGGNQALTRELIDSYVALASVAADASKANTGDHQLASAILGKAGHLADALDRDPSADAASYVTLAGYYRAAARNANFYGSADAAQSHARRAVAAAERLEQLAPGQKRSAEELAAALITLADVTSDLHENDMHEKIALRERALAMYKTLAAGDPSTAHLRNMALAYKDLAGSWSDLGEYRRSLDAAVEAKSLDEKIRTNDPSSPEARWAVAFDLGEIGWVWFKLNNFPRAAESMRENVALREQAVSLNPDDRRGGDRLAYALRDLADVEVALGQRSVAQRDLRRTISLYQTLAAHGPLLMGSLDRFATTSAALGQMEMKAGNKGRGCTLFRTAAGLLDEYRRRSPSPPDAKDVEEIKAGVAGCE